MTPVTPCSSLVSWSVGEVWAAHGFMRCISSINTGSVFLSTQDRWPLFNIFIAIFLSLYYTFEIRWWPPSLCCVRRMRCVVLLQEELYHHVRTQHNSKHHTHQFTTSTYINSMNIAPHFSTLRAEYYFILEMDESQFNITIIDYINITA